MLEGWHRAQKVKRIHLSSVHGAVVVAVVVVCLLLSHMLLVCCNLLLLNFAVDCFHCHSMSHCSCYHSYSSYLHLPSCSHSHADYPIHHPSLADFFSRCSTKFSHEKKCQTVMSCNAFMQSGCYLLLIQITLIDFQFNLFSWIL